jgi:hypothetical protein
MQAPIAEALWRELSAKARRWPQRIFTAFVLKRLQASATCPTRLRIAHCTSGCNANSYQKKSSACGERKIEPQAAPLRERLSKWIEEQLPRLKDAEPRIPEQLNDRQQDGAECLLAIADAAGGLWPSKARKALVELYTGTAPKINRIRLPC